MIILKENKSPKASPKKEASEWESSSKDALASAFENILLERLISSLLALIVIGFKMAGSSGRIKVLITGSTRTALFAGLMFVPFRIGLKL